MIPANEYPNIIRIIGNKGNDIETKVNKIPSGTMKQSSLKENTKALQRFLTDEQILEVMLLFENSKRWKPVYYCVNICLTNGK